MNGTHNRAKSIFLDAIENCPPERWDAFLDEACRDDSDLRQRVQTLLAAHQGTDSLIDNAALAAAAPDHLPVAEGPGAVVGPDKLLEAIGEGGMGVVYVAEQNRPVRRRLARKVIKPGMDTKQVVARFEAERQALAMMDHPNIARVLDAGATGSGRPYFVMELVHGTPITDYCDREKLTIAERLELFVLVCRAVQHAHQKGVIHRDLKPSNILVTVVDGAAVPKIIDFGVAKATGFSLTERTLYTGIHQLIGTPMYMSPEQAQLAGADVDTRSDVYSLGVLLYELLAGTTPFDQETFRTAAFDVLRRIIREQEPPKPSTQLTALGAARTTVSANRKADPRHLDRALRGELDWIVMKALEKDRRRYETAGDLAADVMRYLTDRPVEAGPPSAWYRFSKYARRNRAALTTATLVATALLIGTGSSAWQAVRATRAEARASANEAQAKAAAGAERTARQAEVNERRRAEASERQAKERLVEVERQRKQAEKNLETALEAVDRMLGHVGDRELNNVPRAGPMRRKILNDAIAFYERLPLQSDASAEARFRVAQTWKRIGTLAWELEVYEQATRAHGSAIVLLEGLVAEQPGRTQYRASLADSLHDSGWMPARRTGSVSSRSSTRNPSTSRARSARRVPRGGRRSRRTMPR
jgi:serine/threonine protein kinase